MRTIERIYNDIEEDQVGSREPEFKEFNKGDKVRIQSEDFIRSTSQKCENPGVDVYYQYIGGSDDSLQWIHGMFEYCDRVATITEKASVSKEIRYLVDIDGGMYSWIPSMFYQDYKNYPKFRDKLAGVSSFNEDLL